MRGQTERINHFGTSKPHHAAAGPFHQCPCVRRRSAPAPALAHACAHAVTQTHTDTPSRASAAARTHRAVSPVLAHVCATLQACEGNRLWATRLFQRGGFLRSGVTEQPIGSPPPCACRVQVDGLPVVWAGDAEGAAARVARCRVMNPCL